jgi:hypothetical protein
VADRKHELADFDPVDGHLHRCHVPGQVAANNERVEPCDCAGHLFAIAQDVSTGLARVHEYAESHVSSGGSVTLRHLDHIVGLCEEVYAGCTCASIAGDGSDRYNDPACPVHGHG